MKKITIASLILFVLTCSFNSKIFSQSLETLEIKSLKIETLPIVMDKSNQIKKLADCLDILYQLYIQKKDFKEFARQTQLELTNERVVVTILPPYGQTIAQIDDQLLEQLNVEIQAKAKHSLRAAIPIAQLEQVATTVTGIGQISQPIRPLANAITSEGVALMNANSWQAAGYNGSGSKVAVIDGGFYKLTAAQTNGDIPATYYSMDLTGTGLETSSSGEHGTAVTEAIYDIAPQADYYLYKIGDMTDLENAKDDCINHGVHIINHSMAWFNQSYYDGTGPVCDIINNAIASGITWVNSAGNYADKHYRSTFNPDQYNYHSYASDANINLIGPEPGYVWKHYPGEWVKVALNWDNYPTTNQDYDLYLVRWTGSTWVTAKSSTSRQNGSTAPTEFVSYQNNYSAGYYGVVVHKYSASTNVDFTLFSYYKSFAYQTHESSVLDPATATNVIAVGAINQKYYESGPQESFSSQGPTTDGRPKPDVTAPDSCNSYAYGCWQGTSSASPHTAGICALIKSRFPTYSNSQIRDYLYMNSTVDLGDPGRDNIYGWGKVVLPGIEQITVILPNGGENWPVGTPQNITWTSDGSSGNVKIELSRDSGANWETLFSNTPDDQAESWIATGPTSSNCLIKVADVDGIPLDQSDNFFTISSAGPEWTVPLAINGDGKTFTRTFGGDAGATTGYDAGIDMLTAPPGMTYYAYFEIAQFPNFLDTDIRAWASPYQADIDWTLKIVNATGTTSTLSWNPAKLPPQGTFTLEGVNNAIDLRTQSSISFSGDRTLTIKYRLSAESITIISPNGGEYWKPGNTYNITWINSNFSDPVQIEYSINGGTSWLDPSITSNTSNNGSYPWTIPNTPSTNCKVRISDAVDGAPWDVSDNVFSIGQENAVDVWPPADTTGAPNSIVSIPIYVREVTNKEIYSILLTVNTDANVLTPLDASSVGTITNVWGVPTANISGGDITISMAGTSALAGDGNQRLIYIRYQVGTTPQATTPITLKAAMFNEGQPIANIKHGNFTIASNFKISGGVTYYFNNKPVANVLMSLTGDMVKSTNTNTTGSYELIDLPGGNYVLTPGKVNDLANSISPFDASMILRYSVNTISLNPYQLIAADVSGNGQVTPYDASLILRYNVGSIAQFPVGKEWTFIPTNFPIDLTNWTTAPDSSAYKPLASDQSNQDFVGIVYGDVSGNWQGQNVLSSNSSVELELGTFHFGEGKWSIPLQMNFIGEIFSVKTKLFIKNSNLEFISTSIDNLSSDNLLFAVNNVQETVDLALASGKSLNNQRLKFIFHFDGSNTETLTPSDFDVIDVALNDNDNVTTIVKDNGAIDFPTEWHLFTNHPNPFNAETYIGYQVPVQSHVTIEIFNLVGQRLCMLVNEDKSPGTYKAIWNGKDDQGRSVGSGIYIYRMDAGDFTATKKMVLVQ